MKTSILYQEIPSTMAKGYRRFPRKTEIVLEKKFLKYPRKVSVWH